LTKIRFSFSEFQIIPFMHNPCTERMRVSNPCIDRAK